MSNSDENDREKGMMPEILPDPKQAERDLEQGSPRSRTAAHLKKVMAAVAGLAMNLGGAAVADTSTPKPGDKPNNDPPPKKEPTPPPPRERLGYEVVDMLPPPAKKPGEGFLSVNCKPVAKITIDGRDMKLNTPQMRLKLSPGTHVVSLTLINADKKAPARTENFTVEIIGGETTRIQYDMSVTPSVKKEVKPTPPPPSYE